MQPEIDYVKIGRHIKAARLEKGYSQANLGALVGCSNNHMSHIVPMQNVTALSIKKLQRNYRDAVQRPLLRLARL